MFNKQILWCGLTGYAVGVGYSIMIESLTKNKWETYYKNHQLADDVKSSKHGLLSYFVSMSSIIGASTGIYIGYRLQ